MARRLMSLRSSSWVWLLTLFTVAGLAIVAGTPAGLLTIFPLAAVVTLIGIGALAVAHRQPVGE